MPVAQKDVFKAQEEEELKAQERAKNAGNGTPPLFLYMKDKQKVFIRPLVNYTGMLTLYMHSKYNPTNPKEGINAVCADEVGGECLYCDAAKSDRELTPETSFFLPVWLHLLKQQKMEDGKVVKDQYGSPIWEEAMYEDKDKNKHRVSGFRVLELKRVGAIKTLLMYFRKIYEDTEYGHDITACDFAIERDFTLGEKGKKSIVYTPLIRAPKPMTDEIKGAIPTLDDLRARILEKCPPSGSVVTSEQGKSGNGVSADDEDF